jgi:predicted DNA-binding ribbon-helix-helix protein
MATALRGPMSREAAAGEATASEATDFVKRSLTIAGHRTSLSLEAAFWRRLEALAAAKDVSLSALVAEVDASRREANLSSALRVFALETSP